MPPTDKKDFTRICLAALAILIAATVTVFYTTRFAYRTKIFRYPGFGIDIHSEYHIHGIDISHYQSQINWQDVKQMEFQHVKIGFGFIKATEGTDLTDDYYFRNWYEAKKNNITVGAYHFFTAGISGTAQAQHFIDMATLGKDDLPPVLDVEEANGVDEDELLQEIQDWLTTVENNYHIKPIIYTNIDFYEDYLDGKFTDYPIWIANYLGDANPDIGRGWLFWQHSANGHVNGIDGYVDFNVFSGDSTAFNAILLK